MSDLQLRKLERAWQETQSPEILDQYLSALYRVDPAAVDAIITAHLSKYDIPYRYNEEGFHQIPMLTSRGRRVTMVFKVIEGAQLLSVSDVYQRRAALDHTHFIEPPTTFGLLLNYMPRRLAWSTQQLAETITRIINDYPDAQIQIHSAGRRELGFYLSDKPNPHSWVWELRVPPERYSSELYNTTLHLLRNPFADTLEFIVNNTLWWGTEYEVQGLRLSGPRYLEYGSNEPDEEDDPYDHARYHNLDYFDSITDSMHALQNLLNFYIRELRSF